jgi:hypothetical protein
LQTPTNVQKKQQRDGSSAPFVVLEKLIGVARIGPAQTAARFRGAPYRACAAPCMIAALPDIADGAGPRPIGAA